MTPPSVIHISTAPKDWKANPRYVYIGRPGYFGNPYKLSDNEERGATLQRFEQWARDRFRSDVEYKEAVMGLSGKILVCFCAPSPCHGEVLAKLCQELHLVEHLAKIGRIAWSNYAIQTLKNPPHSFTKSWEETGEWGREGNRVVAAAIMEELNARYNCQPRPWQLS